MDRDGRHGRIEGVDLERELLGDAVQGAAQVCRSLRPHDLGWLDRRDVPVDGLVRAGAGADVDHASGFTERCMDQSGDAWIGSSHLGVPGTVALVVEVTSRD